jgi:hypothetical protein
MRIVATVVTLTGVLISVLVVLDVLVFLLRMHGPFTATGEALLFIASLGRRKPRFSAQPWKSPLQLKAEELRSLLVASGLGALFWLLVAGATLYAIGPIPQVHQW